MKPLKRKLLPTDIWYDLFIRFHSGQITERAERQNAKDILFFIHYGSWDCEEAFAEAARVRKTLAHPGTPGQPLPL